MKNIYQSMAKKLVFLRKNLITLLFKWLNYLKKDFSFYNNHTELLAIWTILFMAITGLLILAIKSNPLIMFLLFILTVVIMLIGYFSAVYYIHALRYHNKKRLLPRLHDILNKSFKLRSLLRFAKIPHISILNLVKNFRLAH